LVARLKPADAAMEVFREAVRLGFPALFKRLSSTIVLVSNERGKGTLHTWLLDTGYLVASSEPNSAWYLKLARLSGGRLVERYVASVPGVVGYHQHLISTFEVDVWTRRLSLAGRLRPCGCLPPRLAPYRALGAEVLELAETGDYAARLGSLIVAWYNPAVDKLDDAFKYQAAMGLLR